MAAVAVKTGGVVKKKEETTKQMMKRVLNITRVLGLIYPPGEEPGHEWKLNKSTTNC